MANLDNVTTKEAHSVWKSPDGQREIIEVVLDYQGKELKAKTYSANIGRQGWSGAIESYEKQGRNGVETFVKQPAKEGFSGGGSGGRSYGGGGGGKTSDPFAMYLSYAKDLAVAMLKDGELDKAKYAEVLADVATGGHVLFEARNVDKPETPAAQVELKDNNLDAIFGSVDQSIPAEETPWGSL